MSTGKTVAMTFRVTPEFKQLLQRAAKHEHRSNTNMLEKLVHDYCQQLDLAPVTGDKAEEQPAD